MRCGWGGRPGPVLTAGQIVVTGSNNKYSNGQARCRWGRRRTSRTRTSTSGVLRRRRRRRRPPRPRRGGRGAGAPGTPPQQRCGAAVAAPARRRARAPACRQGFARGVARGRRLRMHHRPRPPAAPAGRPPPSAGLAQGGPGRDMPGSGPARPGAWRPRRALIRVMMGGGDGPRAWRHRLGCRGGRACHGLLSDLEATLTRRET
jgi:hypothetical protein